MKRIISGIYSLMNMCNQSVYVGSSVNIGKRWRDHKSELNCQKHDNLHLQAAWNKYGADAFEFTIEEEIPAERLLEIEQKYLDIAKLIPERYYNIAYTAGHSMLGRKHSIETRKQLSISHMGKPGYFAGKKRSKEDVEKMAASKRGKKLSVEHKNKISLALKGIVHSIERREKLSKARIGIKFSPEHCANLSKAHKGKNRKPLSAETIAKMSLAAKGRKMSDEQKEKIRQAQLKHHHPEMFNLELQNPVVNPIIVDNSNNINNLTVTNNI